MALPVSIAWTTVGAQLVSTTDLQDGVYETTISSGHLNLFHRFYLSHREAECGHEIVVAVLRGDDFLEVRHCTFTYVVQEYLSVLRQLSL